jgi:hypothetical protein
MFVDPNKLVQVSCFEVQYTQLKPLLDFEQAQALRTKEDS